MAKLPFTVERLWFDAQNECQTIASLIIFLLRFLRPTDFFILAGLKQSLVTHVLRRYGLGENLKLE